MSVWYEGHRNYDGTGPNRVERVDASGRAPLDPRLDVRNHSPTGLEWGYGGSGPAQLALALCIDALAGDVARAGRIYQHFKWMIVGHFDEREWTITADAILATIERIEADLRDDDLYRETGFRTPEVLKIETTTCLIHGTEHDARQMCPICEGEAKADGEGAWNR